MIIRKEEWLDKSSNEAIVIVSDEDFCVAAFCHPYHYKIGYKLIDPLHLLDAKGFERVETSPLRIVRHNTGLAHDFCAVLEDYSKKVFSVNNMLFEVDEDIPSDLRNGDLVKFSCSRVDLW